MQCTACIPSAAVAVLPSFPLMLCRFAMAGTPKSRAAAFEHSAQLAAVTWVNATSGTATVPDPRGLLSLPDVAVESLMLTYGALAKDSIMFGEADRERVLLKPFFSVSFAYVVLSTWGVLQVCWACHPSSDGVGRTWTRFCIRFPSASW